MRAEPASRITATCRFHGFIPLLRIFFYIIKSVDGVCIFCHFYTLKKDLKKIPKILQSAVSYVK